MEFERLRLLAFTYWQSGQTGEDGEEIEGDEEVGGETGVS